MTTSVYFAHKLVISLDHFEQKSAKVVRCFQKFSHLIPIMS